LVRRLDEAIRVRDRWYEEHGEDAGAGEEDERAGRRPGIAWKTAWNCWSEMGAALREACSSKDKSLRVLTYNPSTTSAAPTEASSVRSPSSSPARS